MKVFTRLLCLLLVLSLSVLAFAACSGDSDGEESKGETSASGDTEGFRLQKKDFGGIEIHILTDQATDYLKCEIAPVDFKDDRVQTATYNRAKMIEQEYGIVLVQDYAENQDDVKTKADEQVKSNLNDYQVFCAGVFYLAPLAIDGYFVDLANISENNYIDLKQPYWDQAMTRDLTILGSTYFATGDALISDDDATWAVFFNKNVAKDNNVADPYGADSLYQLVNEGKWTIDVMHEIAKAVTRDDGDGNMEFSTSTKDLWGIAAQCYDSLTFTFGCGQTLTRNNGDSVSLLINEEANIKAFAKTYDLLKDKGCTAITELDNKGTDHYNDLVQIFANGQALFMPNQIRWASSPVLRESEVDYGILPIPKYDEAQEDYLSAVTNYWISAFAIPVTTQSNAQLFDATCYALEALAYHGMTSVTQEYYEYTLKDKRFKDDESGEMLDLIFSNRSYDIGGVFYSDILGFYTMNLFNETNSHKALAEQYSSMYMQKLESLIEDIKMNQDTQ